MEEEEAKEESTAVIKPNNPHLAGGEQKALNTEHRTRNTQHRTHYKTQTTEATRLEGEKHLHIHRDRAGVQGLVGRSTHI